MKPLCRRTHPYRILRRHHSRRIRCVHIITLLLCALSICLILHPPAAPRPLRLFPDAVSQTVRVYLHQQQSVQEMSLDAYLMRVVAAEMPASFHLQALCAQAVASRSYTCFRISSGGCASHPEADICTNSACCQAYLSEDTEIDTRIIRAVFDTASQVLTYDGKIIDALYHACSGGFTANAEDVFSTALPYLRAVESSDEESYPQYAAQHEFSTDALAAIFPIDLSEPLEKQFMISADEHGRAVCVTAAGKTYSGTQFRRLLNLPSARMSFSFSASGMTVSTIGYGHGVGMSQTGADAMARRGADYRQILEHYYTGCKIEQLE